MWLPHRQPLHMLPGGALTDTDVTPYSCVRLWHRRHRTTEQLCSPVYIYSSPVKTHQTHLCMYSSPVKTHQTHLCMYSSPVLPHQTHLCMYNSPVLPHQTHLCMYNSPVKTHQTHLCTHSLPVKPSQTRLMKITPSDKKQNTPPFLTSTTGPQFT